MQANVVTIAAEVTGKVTAVHMTENQRVAAGDPLFELDDAVYKNAVTQAQAQVESAGEAMGSYAKQIEAASAAVESATAANDAAQAQLGLVGLAIAGVRYRWFFLFAVLLAISIKVAVDFEPLTDTGHVIALLLGVLVGLLMQRKTTTGRPA